MPKTHHVKPQTKILKIKSPSAKPSHKLNPHHKINNPLIYPSRRTLHLLNIRPDFILLPTKLIDLVAGNLHCLFGMLSHLGPATTAEITLPSIFQCFHRLVGAGFVLPANPNLYRDLPLNFLNPRVNFRSRCNL